MSRIRFGGASLAIAGVLFVLYPALRPWGDKSVSDSEAVRTAFASSNWVAAHFAAMIGFILVSLGLLALWKVVSRTRGEATAFAAVVVTWIGAGLTLPYFGAEDFALNALAVKNADVVTLAEAIRFQPLAVITFALGLVSLAIGGILAAVAVWRSGVLPRFSGVLFGLGYALFLPQFYTPPAARVGHGIMLGIGLVWLGFEVWKASAAKE